MVVWEASVKAQKGPLNLARPWKTPSLRDVRPLSQLYFFCSCACSIGLFLWLFRGLGNATMSEHLFYCSQPQMSSAVGKNLDEQSTFLYWRNIYKIEASPVATTEKTIPYIRNYKPRLLFKGGFYLEKCTVYFASFYIASFEVQFHAFYIIRLQYWFSSHLTPDVFKFCLMKAQPQWLWQQSIQSIIRFLPL